MTIERDFSTLEEAFPSVDPGVTPLGARILLQLKSVKRASKGGILLVNETRETEKAQSLVAKVISMGSLCFKNRDTAQDWPEGTWVQVGEFCRVPRWSGDRFEVPHPDDPEDTVAFQIMNDFELFCKVNADRVLDMRQFVV